MNVKQRTEEQKHASAIRFAEFFEQEAKVWKEEDLGDLAGIFLDLYVKVGAMYTMAFKDAPFHEQVLALGYMKKISDQANEGVAEHLLGIGIKAAAKKGGENNAK